MDTYPTFAATNGRILATVTAFLINLSTNSLRTTQEDFGESISQKYND